MTAFAVETMIPHSTKFHTVSETLVWLLKILTANRGQQ